MFSKTVTIYKKLQTNLGKVVDGTDLTSTANLDILNMLD